MNKRFFILGILTILILLAALVGGRFPYLLLFIAFFVITYSHYSLSVIEKNLMGVFWADKQELNRGDSVNVSYKIYNGGLLPVPYGDIVDGIPKGLWCQGGESTVSFIFPFESMNIERKVKCQRRGVFKLGEINANIGDIFGINNKRITIEDELQLIVYPKVYELMSFNLLGREFYGKISTDQKMQEDYSSIKDMRKYQIGDSLKKVNWKVTAKKGELYVKNYDAVSNIKIQIFIDFQLDKFENDQDGLIEEKIVECAVSIVHFSLYRSIDTNFIVAGNEKLQFSSRDSGRFKEFLELCTLAKPSKNINLGDVIENESRGLSPGTTTIIITSDPDSKLKTSALSLKSRGYNTIFIVVRDFLNDKSKNQSIKDVEMSGITVCKLDLKDDIAKVLR